MAENEIGKASEKVEKIDQGDRVLKQTTDDAVVGDNQQQEFHSEAKQFDNQNNLSDPALISPKKGESLEDFTKRVEEIQNNRFAITGLDEPPMPDPNDSMTTSEAIEFGGDDAISMIEAIENMPDGPEKIAAKEAVKRAYTEVKDESVPEGFKSNEIIASNLTPTNSIKLDDTLLSPDEIKTSRLPDDTLAWDPIKDINDGFNSAKEKVYFVHRDKLDQFYNFEAARSISQKLPGLANYSERHHGIGPKLIRAIMRNEQTYYGIDDAIMDGVVKQTGNKIKKIRNITTGPGQMSLSNINHLAEKYQDVFDKKTGSELAQLSTDPFVATLLVGAYIDDRIEKFESWKNKEPKDPSKLNHDDKLLYKNAFPLWKVGLETKALIMAFNPGARQKDHMNNVLKQLDLIDKTSN